MAKSFSNKEWQIIHDKVLESGEDFGLPEQRDDSVVLGSFNIRKLGKTTSKSTGAWKMLAMICERFDLLAIQEVQDDLDGLKHLHSTLGDSYGLVASDTTGCYPGERQLAERLAFFFKWKKVQRTEIASDITYDRTKIANTLFENRDDFWKAFEEHSDKLDKLKIENDARTLAGKRKKSSPPVPHPHFISFIRQPLCVSFEIKNNNTVNPCQFLAINCHLLYGEDKEERRREFLALISWLVERARNYKKMYYPNMIMMGDCNLNFRKPKVERPKIDNFIKSLNKEQLGSGSRMKINFPLLDIHPGETEIYRTNARQKETFDQIAIISRDKRLPDHKQNKKAGNTPGEYNYGVFNFVELFSQALHGVPYKKLPKKDQTALINKFEHDLTDHLPVWIRLPMPN